VEWSGVETLAVALEVYNTNARIILSMTIIGLGSALIPHRGR